MKIAKHGIYNIFTGVFGQLATIIFAFLTPKLVIENYGSEINGLLHSFTQIFTYFSLFEAGVGYASLQALYGPVANKDEKKIEGILSATRVFYNRTGLLYAAGVTAVALLYPLAVHISLPYFYVAAIIFFGGIGGCINFFYQGKYIQLMQVEGYTYVTTSINTFCNILISVFKVVLLLCGYNVLSVQISAFLVSVIRATLFYLYIHKHYRLLNLKAPPDFDAISQKNSVLVHQISYLVFSSTDVLLLTFLTQDLRIVSVYTLYNMIVSTAFSVVQQISSGFDFYLGQMYSTAREKYLKIYHALEIFHLVVVYSVMSTIYLSLMPFMRLYMGKVTDIDYFNKIYPLLFVLIPLLTHGRTAANSTITFAGHFEKTQKYAIYEALINLAVTFVGVILWGIPGALLGTIIASIFRTININWYVYKFLIPVSPLKTIKRWGICLGLFLVIVIANTIHPVALSGYLQIALFALLTGCGMLALYGGIQFLANKEEQIMIVELIKVFSNKIFAKKLISGE